jgi:hypothetical protein
MPSDDLLREQSYLVAKGVRPLALVVEGRSSLASGLAHLERFSLDGNLAFVIENEAGDADAGYARAGWVVHLLYWLRNTEIPQERRAQILGLLLGYSADEIGRFSDADAGTRYLQARLRCTPN